MYNELLNVATLYGITGREHILPRQVHWVIDLSPEGKLLSFSPTVAVEGRRGKRFHCPKNYHMQLKDGKIQSVCTNQNNWLPDFMIGPVDELFPGGVNGSRPRTFGKRMETWKIIAQAARDLPSNITIQGIKQFLKTRPDFLKVFRLNIDDEKYNQILDSLKKGKENITFRVRGMLAVFDPELIEWWRLRVLHQREIVTKQLPIGSDLLSDAIGPLAEYFPTVLGGTPMISYNKAPFRSFGLGSQTTPMLLENAEKCATTLNVLCDDPNTSLWLGGMTSIFWAANNERCLAPGFSHLLEVPDPLAVKDFLKSPWGGVSKDLPDGKCYSVILKKTKGRFSVRSWHETTLVDAKKNLRFWFEILDSLTNVTSSNMVLSRLSDLAKCTVQESEKSGPPFRTYNELFETAMFGKLLPSHLYMAALARQSLELAKGCHKKTRTDFENRLRARTALMKLYISRKGVGSNMNNHTEQNDAAYLCGRLLALLDKIHFEAHAITIEKNGKKIKVAGTSSSPANRSYAAASTTPALAFPQLCKLARYHLNKADDFRAACLEHGYIEKDSGKTAEGLKQICSRLREAAGCNFPRTLSLEEQGRFAIGFYYERCQNWDYSKATPLR